MYLKHLLTTTALTLALTSGVYAESVSFATAEYIDPAEWDYGDALDYLDEFSSFKERILKETQFKTLLLGDVDYSDDRSASERLRDGKGSYKKTVTPLSAMTDVSAEINGVISQYGGEFIFSTARGNSTFPMGATMPPREKQILKHIDIDNDGEDEILWVTPFQ